MVRAICLAVVSQQAANHNILKNNLFFVQPLKVRAVALLGTRCSTRILFWQNSLLDWQHLIVSLGWQSPFHRKDRFLPYLSREWRRSSWSSETRGGSRVSPQVPIHVRQCRAACRRITRMTPRLLDRSTTEPDELPLPSPDCVFFLIFSEDARRCAYYVHYALAHTSP